MKRKITHSVAAGLILTACSISLSAPPAGIPGGSDFNGISKAKAQYSSRPKSQLVEQPIAEMRQPTFAVGEKALGQTMEHVRGDGMLSASNGFTRRAPAPPNVPQRVEAFEFPSREIIVSETVIEDGLIVDGFGGTDLGFERAVDRPLSGIGVKAVAKDAVVACGPPQSASPWTSSVAVDSGFSQPITAPKTMVGNISSTVNTTNTTPQPQNTAARDADEFNARLAKIQLEKKNTEEMLNLIDRIKSPNFKVKTLVDLTEYVSRDSNYNREAELLYQLAVSGIDALAAGRPIVVKKAEPTIQAKAPVVPIQKKDSTPTTPLITSPLIPKREDPQVSTTTTRTTVPTAAPKKTLTLVDEPDDDLPTLQSTRPSIPQSSGPVMAPEPAGTESIETPVEKPGTTTMSDEGPILELQPKQPEKKSPVTQSKRRALTLLDELDDDELPSLKNSKATTETLEPETTEPEKKETTTVPARPRRRLSLLESEDEFKADDSNGAVGELPGLPALPKKPDTGKPALKPLDEEKVSPMVEPRLSGPTSPEPTLVDPKRDILMDSGEQTTTKSIKLEQPAPEEPKPKRRSMPRRGAIVVE